MKRAFVGGVVLGGLLAWQLPASAQNSGCILDNCADKRPPVAQSGATASRPADADATRPGPRGASQPGSFDFYVLSLSWSPGFCATGGNEKAPAQCEPGRGLGFVVHGLWPQYERGYPQDCGAGRAPSRVALDAANGLYPSQNLARYEWRKHGTCAGKSPSDYFADVRRARDALVVPASFERPAGDQTWAPLDILRAFEASNPRLRPGMSAIGCRQGTFEEVRVCMTKDLREFRACPEVARATCRTREITVPAPL